MAKKIRAESATGNGPVMDSVRATEAGKLVARLLSLDTGDAVAVAAFSRHLTPHTDMAQRLGSAAALFKAALAEVDNHCRADAFDAARACFRVSVTDARANVRAAVGRMIFYKGASAWTWIGNLAGSDPRFRRLDDDQGREFVQALIDRARARKGRKVNAAYVAAALSLRVNAFDDMKKPGETDAAACRRVAKSFEQAVTKAALKENARGRSNFRGRLRGAKSSSVAITAARKAAKTAP